MMVACFSSSFLLFLVPMDVWDAPAIGSEDGTRRRLLLTAAAAAAAAATAAAAAETEECLTEPADLPSPLTAAAEASEAEEARAAADAREPPPPPEGRSWLLSEYCWRLK